MARNFLQLMKKLGFFPKGFLPTEEDYEQSRALNTANFLGYCMKNVRCSKKARRNWKKKTYQRSVQELKTERRQSATLIVPLNLVKLYKGQVMAKCIKPLRFLKRLLKSSVHLILTLSWAHTHIHLYQPFMATIQHSALHFNFKTTDDFCTKYSRKSDCL